MNKVFLNGYLARDPESGTTQKGLEFANFSVGVNDIKKWDDTFFIRCTAWGPTAKYVANNLTKGQFVAIDGRLSSRSYINKEGKTSYITEVIVDNIRGYGNTAKKNDVMSEDLNAYTASEEGLEIKTNREPAVNNNVNLDDIFKTTSYHNEPESSKVVNDDHQTDDDNNNDWDDLDD